MASNYKNVSLSFGYEGTSPNFERDQVRTLAELKAIVDTIDEGHITYVLENKKHYVFKSSNPLDATTGKWRELHDGLATTAQVQAATPQGFSQLVTDVTNLKNKVPTVESTANAAKSKAEEALTKATQGVNTASAADTKATTNLQSINAINVKINKLEAGIKIVKITKQAYDALPTKDENTVYFITSDR